MMTEMMLTQRNMSYSFVNQFPRKVPSYNHSCRLFLVRQYEPLFLQYREEKNALNTTPACFAGKSGNASRPKDKSRPRSSTYLEV